MKIGCYISYDLVIHSVLTNYIVYASIPSTLYLKQKSKKHIKNLFKSDHHWTESR